MALWVCGGVGGCGTKYAVGLFRCPRCHNTEFYEDGDPMAKITRHSGASDKTVPAPEVAAVAETDPMPEVAADQPEAEPEALDVTEDVAGPAEPVVEGGEGSSPGSSSSASTGPQPTNSGPSSKPRRKPARRTASRSGQDPTESSSAPSMGGPSETDTSTADGSEESS